MPNEIRMPRLSQTTDEVKLLRWRVQVGETVRKGDALCEVETDKTTMDVESVADGTVVRLLVEADTSVDAETPIAVVQEAHDGQLLPDSEHIKATVLVKNLAKKRGIDLREVVGTGPAGLITAEDIESFAGTRPQGGRLQEPGKLCGTPLPGSEIRLSPNQVFVARHAAQSKREIPHYYLKTTVLADAIQDSRSSRRRGGNTIAVDSFFIFAVAQSLGRYPKINAYFDNDKAVRSETINVGFAVAVGEDLVVPVVKDAGNKTIEQINAEVGAFTAQATAKTLAPADVREGTFTISNLSAFGVDEFYAVISQRQAAVLAIGKFRKTLDLDHKERISIRTVCTLTGSFDHRLINGAQAAGFMRSVRQVIEKGCV